MYNQIIATTTEYAIDNSIIGYSVTVKTLNFLDITVMLLLVITFFVMVGFFRKLFK